MLPRMDQNTSLIEQGLEHLRQDLLDLLGGANLHLQPETISAYLRARLRAQLKRLETILRRLILLLALTLDLAPVRPRATRQAVSVPGGVEDVTASFRAHLPKQYRMALIPRPFGPPGTFGALASARCSGPVPAMPLMVQAAVLLNIMKQPEPAARRMARMIERMKRRGEAKPYCLPIASRNQLRPEMALIAGAVTLAVNAGLADWPVRLPDTG